MKSRLICLSRVTDPQSSLGDSRSGISLLELVVSLGISSILLAGMTSTLVMAVQANNINDDHFSRVDVASDALSQLDRELSYAIEVTSALDAENAIEFIVPDLTGDGIEERIRYQWSGTISNPLERIFNDGIPQPVIPAVDQFQIELQTHLIHKLGDPEESPSQLWINQTSSFSSSNHTLRINRGIGTDFVVTLPPEALSWSVTSVDVLCSRNGTNTNGVINARVYTANAQRTPDVMIDQTVILESNLTSSLNWYTVDFQNVQDRSPGERLCVTFEGVSGSSGLATFRILGLSLFSPETLLINTNNVSGSWNTTSLSDMAIRIRGKYVTQYSIDVDFCQYATIQLQVGNEVNSAVHSVVQTRNFPQVTGP